LLTGIYHDKNSWIFVIKLKGLVEESIKNLNFEKYSVYRPGTILNRDNDVRFVEKILKALPFGPKIEASHLGKAMYEHAI
jgi:hypothetical protein